MHQLIFIFLWIISATPEKFSQLVKLLISPVIVVSVKWYWHCFITVSCEKIIVNNVTRHLLRKYKKKRSFFFPINISRAFYWFGVKCHTYFNRREFQHAQKLTPKLINKGLRYIVQTTPRQSSGENSIAEMRKRIEYFMKAKKIDTNIV